MSYDYVKMANPHGIGEPEEPATLSVAEAMRRLRGEDYEEKCNRPNWGSEEFGDTIWVGAMGSNGEKLNEVIFSIDLKGLTDEAIRKRRAYVSTIVNCVNCAGQQSDVIRKLESDVSAQRSELTAAIARAEAAEKEVEAVNAEHNGFVTKTVERFKLLTAERDTALQQLAEAKKSNREKTEIMGEMQAFIDRLQEDADATLTDALAASRQRVEVLEGALRSFPSAGMDEAGTNDAWVFIKDWETWIEKREVALSSPATWPSDGDRLTWLENNWRRFLHHAETVTGFSTLRQSIDAAMQQREEEA